MSDRNFRGALSKFFSLWIVPGWKALLISLFTSLLSLAPMACVYIGLSLANKWSGNQNSIYESGDMIMASSTLMISCLSAYYSNDIRCMFQSQFEAIFTLLILFFSPMAYALVVTQVARYKGTPDLSYGFLSRMSWGFFIAAVVFYFLNTFKEQKVKVMPGFKGVEGERVENLHDRLAKIKH